LRKAPFDLALKYREDFYEMVEREEEGGMPGRRRRVNKDLPAN
jgi:hypothetical protein